MAGTASPRVSVIVPVYNVEEYIDECLSSVLGQTYKNIEIILVDDASPDKSGKKCDQWAQKDARIKVIHKKDNEGLFQARVTGFGLMRGDYFVTVDSDDYVAKDYVKTLLDKALSTHSDIVVSEGFTQFYDDGKEEQQKTPKLYAQTDVLDHLLKNIAASKEKFGWNVWGKMYRAELFSKAEKHLSKITGNINAGEDILFSLIFAHFAQSTANIPSYAGYYYRQNSQSIMHGVQHESFVRKLDSVTSVMVYADQFLKTVGLSRQYKNEITAFKEYLISDNVWAIKNEYIQANTELQQWNTELEQYNAKLRQQIKEMENAKAYKLGRAIVYPYVKVRKLLHL